MALLLAVDHSTCIKCRRCVEVCPATIFRQETPAGEVSPHDIQYCIVCGHCVAACPTSSVIHGDFPAEKVHKIDPVQLPSPEQVMLLCKARRSNRAFSSKPIPAEMLDQILEAAHRAPTASNKQEVEFTLVTDPEKLRGISDLTIDIFASIQKKLKNPVLKPLLKHIIPEVYKVLPAFDKLSAAYANGDDRILRNATAVILIHTPKDSRFGIQDANLAYQNGSLMAESLGVSQFYTGFVCAAIQQDKERKIAKLLGIEGWIQAGMALGMPKFRYPNYIDKKEIRINRQ